MINQKPAASKRLPIKTTVQQLTKKVEVCDKRMNVPAVVSSTCPKCGAVEKRDLSTGDDYLSYPVINGVSKIFFAHEIGDATKDNYDCHEWTVKVRLTTKLVLL